MVACHPTIIPSHDDHLSRLEDRCTCARSKGSVPRQFSHTDRQEQQPGSSEMHFDEGAEALSRGNAVSVRYKDRMWEIDLNLAKTGGGAGDASGEASSIAFDLQAALNLSKPPVGLQLHVAPGAQAVVCPLSVLVACPSYIATTFQGENKADTERDYLLLRSINKYSGVYSLDYIIILFGGDSVWSFLRLGLSMRFSELEFSAK